MLSKLHSVGPGFDRCRNMTLFPNSEFRFKLSSFTETLIDFTQALNALSLSCNFSVFPVAYIANASHVAFTESRLFLTVSNTYWFYLVLVSLVVCDDIGSMQLRVSAVSRYQHNVTLLI